MISRIPYNINLHDNATEDTRNLVKAINDLIELSNNQADMIKSMQKKIKKAIELIEGEKEKDKLRNLLED